MWVGVTVADVLGLDLDKRHEKAKAKAIVSKWIENGVLRKTSAPSKRDGRDVPCVVVQWTDHLGMCRLPPPESANLYWDWGGHTQRGDPQDMEPVAYFDISAFKVLR